MITFKGYLCLSEDLQQDIDKLMSDISMIDAQINQRTQPLLQRKAQLGKLLAVKQKQKQAESRTTTDNSGNAQQSSQQSNHTTTPGGTQAATPGMSANVQTPR